MAITDKTRKMLWGRSGNRCAICRLELVLDRTRADKECVVGDECHIVSSQPQGPRHEPSFSAGLIDAYENLILLCRVHHKMVDDQAETYSPEILSRIKSNHERWVAGKLNDEEKPEPVRVRRIKENIPPVLARITTGKEILDIVDHAMAFSFDHDELESQKEVDLIGRFLELAQNWGEMSDVLEAGGRVQVAFDLTEAMRELEAADFLYSARAKFSGLKVGASRPRVGR